MGKLLDPNSNDLLPTTDQAGGPLVDNEKASQQTISRSAKPRGIDWNEIFRKRPELEPPGYRDAVKYMETVERLK